MVWLCRMEALGGFSLAAGSDDFSSNCLVVGTLEKSESLGLLKESRPTFFSSNLYTF